MSHEPSATPLPRDQVLAQILEAVRADPRITGVLEYGSGSLGRSDLWSDVDLVFVTRDAAAREELRASWRAWCAAFGDLLLAYVGIAWTPCAVYAHPALPVRVDFTFYEESEACEKLPSWDIRPPRLEDVLVFDRSAGGRLRVAAERLLAAPVKPFDLAETFDRASGDLWYFLLRSAAYLARRQPWAVRHNHQIIAERLAALLRLRHGATSDWRTRNPAFAIEKDLPPDTLAALEACIQPADTAALAASLRAMADLGERLCVEISARHQLPWSARLATDVRRLLARA